MSELREALDRLRELLPQISPGPWWQKSHLQEDGPACGHELSSLLCFFDDEGAPRFWDWMHDGEFVTLARNHMGAILRHIEDLEGREP